MEPADVPIAFSGHSSEAKYNIKAVCLRTGIGAATLRAWERRYGLPRPFRSERGYRLYSDWDIAILVWLRHKTEDGMSIAHAIRQLDTLLGSGQSPLVAPSKRIGEPEHGLRSPGVLRRELVSAFAGHDNPTAERIMSEALALYTLETALISIFQQAIGDLRRLHKLDKLPATTEQMAINSVHQRLLSIAQTAPTVRDASDAILMIGFSVEHNEVTLLIVNILLRRQGVPVRLLGTDLDPKLLEQSLHSLTTRLILFYTDDPKNAVRLAAFDPLFNAAGEPIRVMCAGQALEVAPELRAHIDCDYLGSDLREIVRTISSYRSR